MNQKTMISATLMAALTIAIISAAGLMTTAVEAKTVISDGYTLEVPNGWKVKDKENRFSFTDKSISYEKGGKTGVVNIQHSDDTANLGTDSDGLETAVTTMYPDASIFESGDNKYFVNNQSAPYVIATMDKTNLFGYKHHLVIMGVAIRLGEDDGMYLQFIAEQNDFDKLLGQVEGMIQSVKPTASL